MSAVHHRLALSRTGLRVLVYALAALGLVPWLIAAADLSEPWGWRIALCSIGALAAWRVGVGLFDPPRSRHLVAFLDAPSSALWASGVFAVVVLVPLAVWRTFQGTFVLPGDGRISVALGLAAALWAVWGRRRLVQLREIAVPLPELPREFEGYRIAHLSDIHLGTMDGRPTVERWVSETNALHCDLVAITGDLVSSGTRFYADVAQALAGLVAPDGVFVVNGNHDLWDPQEWSRQLQRHGLTVLRHEARAVFRRGASFVVVGLDCTRSRDETLALLRQLEAGPACVVLSHYPDLFRDATRRPALTLSGHTHGGQIALPWLDRWVNLTSVVGGPASGLTRDGPHVLHVSRGLGTTGVPLRFGAAPEIDVIRLVRSEPPGTDDSSPSGVRGTR